MSHDGPVIRNVTSVKSHIDKFSGSGGAIEFLLFQQQVEETKTAGSLTDEAAASAAVKAFKDPSSAKTWHNRMILQNNKDILQWGTLKPLMLARFCKAPTLGEQKKMSDELVQTAGENAADFFDRVALTMSKCDIGLPDTVTKGAGYKTELERKTKDKFLIGLRPNVRNALTGFATATSSMDELLAAALNAEAVLNVGNAGNAAAAAAPIDEIGGDDEMNAEIAAFNARWGARGYQMKPKYDGPKMKCDRCKQWGNHLAATCQVNLVKLAERLSAGRGRGGGRGFRGGDRGFRGGGRGGGRGAGGGRGGGQPGGGLDEVQAEQDGFGFALNG